MNDLTPEQTNQYRTAAAREVVTEILRNFADSVEPKAVIDLLSDEEEYGMGQDDAKAAAEQAIELLKTVSFKFPTT